MTSVQKKSVKLPLFSKARLSKSLHLKVAIGYIFVSIVGISSFYFAKKDINENRVRNMKIKDEIVKSKSFYSDRFKFISEKNLKFEESKKNLENEQSK